MGVHLQVVCHVTLTICRHQVPLSEKAWYLQIVKSLMVKRGTVKLSTLPKTAKVETGQFKIGTKMH